jgi:hypothetical protein
MYGGTWLCRQGSSLPVGGIPYRCVIVCAFFTVHDLVVPLVQVEQDVQLV